MKSSLIMLAAAAAAVAVAAVPTVPNFPFSYSTVEDLTIIGPTVNDAAQDYVYVANDGKEQYWTYLATYGGNDPEGWNAQGGTWYFNGTDPNASNGDIVYIQGGQCDCWCPIFTQSLCDLGDAISGCPYIFGGAKFLRSGVDKQGRAYNEFVKSEYLMGIKMATVHLFVDTKTNLPLAKLDHLTPFGHWEANSTVTFHDFVPGVPPKSKFVSKYDNQCAQCGETQCSDDLQVQLWKMRKNAQKRAFENAKKQVGKKE